MIRLAGRTLRDVYGIMRRRMVHETEIALLYGLRFPERHARIPTVEVGKGRFDPRFSAAFWETALDIDAKG